MSRSVPIAGGLAAGLALLLAGCGGSGDPSQAGPFGGIRTGSIGGCLPVPRGGVATIAATDFPNTGGPARIEKVTLVDPRDLQLVAAWVVPITGNDLIGVFGGYPPLGTKGVGPASLAPGIQWGRRQRADGALIAHTPGQDVINLVLVVKASGVEGTAKTVYVDYESGGTHYRLNMSSSIQVFNGNKRGCLAEK